MAEITTEVDKDADLTVIRIQGDLQSGQLKDFMAEYYEQGPTRLIIMDFSEGHWPKVTMDSYIEASQDAQRYSRPGGRTALVFASQGDFGIGRLLETYFGLSATQTEMNCFMDLIEAREWILSAD